MVLSDNLTYDVQVILTCFLKHVFRTACLYCIRSSTKTILCSWRQFVRVLELFMLQIHDDRKQYKKNYFMRHKLIPHCGIRIAHYCARQLKTRLQIYGKWTSNSQGKDAYQNFSIRLISVQLAKCLGHGIQVEAKTVQDLYSIEKYNYFKWDKYDLLLLI